MLYRARDSRNTIVAIRSHGEVGDRQSCMLLLDSGEGTGSGR